MLLAADERTARMEAVTLLNSSAFLRPALGVFALTDVAVNNMLESLDTSDSNALAKAAQDVLNYLASSAPEEGIRRAAAKQLSP